MITINNLEELEKYRKKPAGESYRKDIEFITYYFKDDVTFNFAITLKTPAHEYSFLIDDDCHVCFTQDAILNNIYGEGNVYAKHNLNLDKIYANELIVDNYLSSRFINCRDLKAKKIYARSICSDIIQSNHIVTDKMSFMIKLSAKELICGGTYFRNVNADNTHLDEDED